MILIALGLLGALAVFVSWTVVRRARAPDLVGLYQDPVKARRMWRLHLPGPGGMFLFWLVGVPPLSIFLIFLMMHLGIGIDRAHGWTPPAAGSSRPVSGTERPSSLEAPKRPRDLALGPTAQLVIGISLFGQLLWWPGAFVLGLMWWSDRRGGGPHGAARWSRWGEITTARDHRWVLPLWVAYAPTARAWKLWERLIGSVGLAPFAPPEGDAVCAHFLVLGATGSGKGASVFAHIMATSTAPTIYQDEKGECPLRDHPRWKEAIRWGCAVEGGPLSQRWNPVEECRRDVDPENAFLSLSAALIPDDVAGRENAWVAKLTRPILAEILASGEYETLRELAEGVQEKPLAQILENARVPEGLRAAMKGENVSEYVMTTLYSELAVFRKGWGRDVTVAHDFTLDELIDRGGYILGAEPEATRRGPIRLLWTLLLRRLMRAGRPRPCNLILDEAAKAGRIPHFAEALVTLRSRGVSIWSAWQSESLILSVYGESEGKAILDGFGNRIALLHGINERDAESLSRASGHWTKTRGGGLSFGLHHGGPSVSYSTGSRDISPIPLITATDLLIRARKPGDRWAIVSVRGASADGHLIMARLVEARP